MNGNGHHLSRTVDTAIVGGGLAGLTAAAYLARAGRDVVVLEKARRPGGRAVTREQEQFHFNLGAHALYVGGHAHQILRELDVPFTGRTPSLGNPYVVVEGEPLTLLRILFTSLLLSVAEKAKLGATLIRLLRTPPAAVENVTAQQWLQQQTGSAAVHRVMLSLLRVASYTNAPQQLSAAVFMRQIQLVVKGNVLYLDGGWQTLVDGLRKTAVDAGARIVTGVQVAAIEGRGRASRVLLDDGRRLTAGSVILAVDPQTVARLLPESEAAQRYADTSIPVEVVTLDVGLRRLPRPKATFAQGVDRPLYYSVHSAAADLTPGGAALVHTLKYLAPDRDHDPEAHEAELEGLLDLIQPGWRDEVVVRRFLPQMTAVRRLATAHEGLSGRPATELPGRDGVYLAGDWVGPDGWLADAALASARTAASLILQRPLPSLQSETLEGV